MQYLIAHCEGVASKWRFTNYRNENGRLNRYGVQLFKHKCFGSYEDWECFARTKGMIIISRLTPMKDYCESFIVGAEGLYLDDCYECGEYDEIDAE